MEYDTLTNQYLEAISKDLVTIRIDEPKDSPNISLMDVYTPLELRKHEPRRSILDLGDNLPNITSKKTGFSILNMRDTISTEESDHISLGEIIKNNQFLVLLGEPGSGKSTMTQFISLCFANQNLGWAQQHLGIETSFVPILLRLRDIAHIFNNQSNTLMDTLKTEVGIRLQENPQFAENLLHYWSKSGQLLILLDGLDETREQRDNVIQHIRNFINSPIGKNTHVIITSRFIGYGTLGNPFSDFSINTISPQKTLSFLQYWLRVLATDWDEATCSERAKELLNKLIKQPSLNRLRENPLNLRLIAETYYLNGYIPHSRSDLYRICIEETWKRAIKRGAQTEKKENILLALQALAWHNLTDEIRGETNALHALGVAKSLEDADNLLHAARMHTGLIAFVQDHYIFNHTTFQEYFVSQRLKSAWLTNSSITWKFLRPRLHLPEWHEPLLLLADTLETNHVKRFIPRVRTAVSSLYEGVLLRDFFLTAEMLNERSEQDLLPLRKRVNNILKIFLDHRDTRVQELAINMLAKMGDPIGLKKLQDEQARAIQSAIFAARLGAQVTGEWKIPKKLPPSRWYINQLKNVGKLSKHPNRTLTKIWGLQALLSDEMMKRYPNLSLRQQKNVISSTQSTCFFLAGEEYYDELYLLLIRLEQFKLCNAKLKDPLQQSYKLKRFITRLIWGILIFILLTTASVFSLLQEKAKDIVKEQLDWLKQEPIGLLITLALLIPALIALIGWAINQLKKRFIS